MRFARIEVDLNSLLREIERREKRLDGEVTKREMRLVMSLKTAEKLCLAYNDEVKNGGCIPRVFTIDSRVYNIRGHRIDLNDGLELGEVLFTEVMAP